MTAFHLRDIALRIGTKTYFFLIESDLFDISDDSYFSFAEDFLNNAISVKKL